MRRRVWLIGGVALLGAAGGGWWWWSGRPGEMSLGPPGLLPPLLRVTVGEEDRLIVLTRRRQREIRTSGGGFAGERVEIRGFEAATLRPRFTAPLLSVPGGLGAGSEIIAAQGATVWVFAGGFGAASAVDGGLLADGPGLERSNPSLHGRMRDDRDAYRFERGMLILRTQDGSRWRLDPLSLRVDSRTEPPSDPPPTRLPVPLRDPAAFLLPEFRQGQGWLGLIPAATKEPDPRRLSTELYRPGIPDAAREPRRLWRGDLTADEWGRPDRIANPQPLAIEPQGLFQAGFLTDGTRDASNRADPMRLSNPDGGLLLYRRSAAGPLHLARLDAKGTVQWRAALPAGKLTAVLPGTPLLLAGARLEDAAELLIAVDAATGAVRAYDLAAETLLPS